MSCVHTEAPKVVDLPDLSDSTRVSEDDQHRPPPNAINASAETAPTTYCCFRERTAYRFGNPFVYHHHQQPLSNDKSLLHNPIVVAGWRSSWLPCWPALLASSSTHSSRNPLGYRGYRHENHANTTAHAFSGCRAGRVHWRVRAAGSVPDHRHADQTHAVCGIFLRP